MGEEVAAQAGGPDAQGALDPLSVTVVGAGIAGLTAAYRLAERGYNVTLYEAELKLGGNLGSRKGAEVGPLDVYPHMFQGWYENFWKLMADVRGGKGHDPREDPDEKEFRPFVSVYQARRPKEDGKPRFAKLTNPYSAATLVENLYSGIAPPADMFVFGYASIDLQAEYMNPTMRLRDISLWGYLSSRPYMTRAAINAYAAFVLRVWGIPAYLMSAEDCRVYGQYCYAAAEKPGWLSKGPAEASVVQKIVDAFATCPGEVKVKKGVTVAGVRVKEVAKDDQGRGIYEADAIFVEKTKDPDKEPHPPAEAPVEQQRSLEEQVHRLEEQVRRLEEQVRTAERARTLEPVPVKNLVLAIPPAALSKVVRAGARDERLVDARPPLAELARFTSAPIPVLHVVLKDGVKIPNLPKDPVALYGSALNLAFMDISQLWTGQFGGKTVLALSCSEPFRLIGNDDDDKFAMVKELGEYLGFDAGTHVADLSAEVNWKDTRYDSNTNAQITLNAVGTDPWRPAAVSEHTPNVFLAGDFCKHDFGITTVEAAVATGLAAANGVIDRVKEGEPEEIIPGKKLPAPTFVGMRYAWMSSAFASGIWSWMSRAGRAPGSEEDWNPDEPLPRDPMSVIGKRSTIRYLLTPGLKPRTRIRE